MRPVLIALFAFTLVSCSSPPPTPESNLRARTAVNVPSYPAVTFSSEQNPSATLSFSHTANGTNNRLILYYNLVIENPRSQPVTAQLLNPHVVLNESYQVAVVPKGTNLLQGIYSTIEPKSSALLPLQLEIDITGLSLGSSSLCSALLTLDTLWNFSLDPKTGVATGASLSIKLSCAASFYLTQDISLDINKFSIDSIANDPRLGMYIRVSNPNAFPLELSSLDYQLYTSGKQSSAGNAPLALLIPANSAVDARILMPVSGLGNIVDLNQLDYRLIGAGNIAVPSGYPALSMPFDLSGLLLVQR
jgi:LEA14-like dessication related protein